MQFSEKTLKILDNFADINPNLLFEEGDVLYTISPNKTIFAKANIEETIDGEAPIYNLKNFIKALSLVKDPDVKFTEHKFVISNDTQNLEYTYAAKNMLRLPPKKNIKMPDVDVTLDVTYEELTKTIEAAGILGMKHLAIVGDEDGIYLRVYDPKNPTSDKYSVRLDDSEVEEPFKVLFMIENLKLLPDNYEVSIAIDKLAKFESPTLEYFIALEKE